MLQRASRARGQVGAEPPAHFAAADEGEKADPPVAGKLRGQLVVGRQQCLTPLHRQAGLVQNPHKTPARQRRRLGRLHDHRAAGRHRRANLVDNQIQRVVEGAERHHHADGLVGGEGQPAGRGGRQAHGHFLAGLGPQALDAQPHAVDGPIRLDQGIHQRLSPFACRFQGQVLSALLHDVGRAAEDFHPAGRAQPGVAIAKQLRRPFATLDLCPAALRRRPWRSATGHRGHRPGHFSARPPPREPRGGNALPYYFILALRAFLQDQQPAAAGGDGNRVSRAKRGRRLEVGNCRGPQPRLGRIEAQARQSRLSGGNRLSSRPNWRWKPAIFPACGRRSPARQD